MTGDESADRYPHLPCEIDDCENHAVARRQPNALSPHPGLPNTPGRIQSVLLCFEHFTELASQPQDDG